MLLYCIYDIVGLAQFGRYRDFIFWNTPYTSESHSIRAANISNRFCYNCREKLLYGFIFDHTPINIAQF